MRDKIKDENIKLGDVIIILRKKNDRDKKIIFFIRSIDVIIWNSVSSPPPKLSNDFKVLKLTMEKGRRAGEGERGNVLSKIHIVKNEQYHTSYLFQVYTLVTHALEFLIAIFNICLIYRPVFVLFRLSISKQIWTNMCIDPWTKYKCSKHTLSLSFPLHIASHVATNKLIKGLRVTRHESVFT